MHTPSVAHLRACSRSGTLVWIISTLPPSMPVMWHMQSRIVTLFSTSRNSGRYFSTRSSIFRMPRSTAIMMAQPVNVFVIENTAKTVSGRIGTLFSASAQPRQSHVSLQPASESALTTPAISPRSTYGARASRAGDATTSNAHSRIMAARSGASPSGVQPIFRASIPQRTESQTQA